MRIGTVFIFIFFPGHTPLLYLHNSLRSHTPSSSSPLLPSLIPHAHRSGSALPARGCLRRGTCVRSRWFTSPRGSGGPLAATTGSTRRSGGAGYSRRSGSSRNDKEEHGIVIRHCQLALCMGLINALVDTGILLYIKNKMNNLVIFWYDKLITRCMPVLPVEERGPLTAACGTASSPPTSAK